MTIIQSSRTGDFLTSVASLSQYNNECCDPYFFTQREVALIVSCLRFIDWDSRWLNREKDTALVERIFEEFMSCRDDIVDELKGIREALERLEEKQGDSEQDMSNAFFVIRMIALVMGVPLPNLPLANALPFVTFPIDTPTP